MKNIKVQVSIFFLLAILSCSRSDTSGVTVSWIIVREGLINKDVSVVEPELEKLLVNTIPKPITGDSIGQKNNIVYLINQINSSGLLMSKLKCYACIQTLPVQSEIIVLTDSAGHNIARIVDLLTPADDRLKLANIHDLKK